MANITSITFSPQFSLLKNRTSGKMIITIDEARETYDIKKIKYILPITMIWIDEFSNNAIRCFCQVKSARNYELAKKLIKFGMIRSDDDPYMVLTFNNGIIRYGPKPELKYSTETEEHLELDAYETKPILIQSIIDVIRANGISVGGFGSANLNLVPDILLMRLGFRNIPEYFERGSNMWFANMESLTNLDERGTSDYASVKSNCLLLIKVIAKIIEQDFGNG